MTAMPITTVIPLFNKRDTIVAAITSALDQLHPPLEVIVVDDASTDDSLEVLRRKFETDDRVRIVRHRTNAGVSAARNTGLREARTEYIAFLDADDHWDPAFLSCIASLIATAPSAGLYASAYRRKLRSEHQDISLYKGLSLDASGLLQNYFQTATYGDQPFCSSSVCLSRERALSVGAFPVGIAYGEDLYLWAKMALLGPIAFTSRPLATYNLAPASRAMRMQPPIQRWCFDLSAAETVFGSPIPPSLRKQITEHIARVNLYTAESSLGFRTSQKMIAHIASIETSDFLARKLTLLLMYLLPYAIRARLIAATTQ